MVVNDVLTLAPRWPPSSRAAPRATLVPHFYPPAAPGLPPFGLGALPPRTRARARRLAAARAARPAGRRARAPGAERDAPSASACLRSRTSYGGISRELCLVGAFPQLEYPRTWPAACARHRPADLGAAGGDVELPAGRRPAGAGRPEHLAGPGPAAAARGARGPGGAPGAGARDLQPPAAACDRSESRERAAGRVAVLLAHDAARRSGRLPRRPRHAGARARVRSRRCVTVPAAGDMGENGARLSGRAPGSACRRASSARGPCAGRCSGCWSSRPIAPARARSRGGRAEQRRRRSRRGAGRGLRRRATVRDADCGYTRSLRKAPRQGGRGNIRRSVVLVGRSRRAALAIFMLTFAALAAGSRRAGIGCARFGLRALDMADSRRRPVEPARGCVHQRGDTRRVDAQRRSELPHRVALPRPDGRHRARRHALAGRPERHRSPTSPSTPPATQSQSGPATRHGHQGAGRLPPVRGPLAARQSRCRPRDRRGFDARVSSTAAARRWRCGRASTRGPAP